MLMQPLKLQLKACLIPYFANIVLSGIVIALIYFLKNSFELYVMLFSIEIIYSFFYGLFNFSTLGKTYSSLKHDKHNFCLSSLIMNIINALIMLGISILVLFLSNKEFSLFVLGFNVLVHMLAFSLGSTYSLYLSKYKTLNIVILIVTFAILFVLSNYILSALNKFYNILGNDINIFVYISFIIMIGFIILFNIINILKYRKQ